MLYRYELFLNFGCFNSKAKYVMVDDINSGAIGGKRQRTSKEIVEALMNDFLDDTRERLGFMEKTLNGLHEKTISIDESLTILKREAHNIKGIASTFDFAIVSKIMHRLEDYLDIAPFDTARQWEDAQVYIDKAEKIINSSVQVNEDDIEEFFISLPDYHKQEESKSIYLGINALLISHSRTISLKVQTELLEMGFGVITEKDPFVALSIIVRSKPKLVIASEELEGLSGINLLRAIGAITSTSDIPIMLLSSFDKDFLNKRGLPNNIPVIGLGSSLNTELRNAVSLFPFN